MPLRKPPNILRPMKDFDPSEPAILHDRISYTIVAWSGEEAAAFRRSHTTWVSPGTRPCQVMLPGRKQRIEMPSGPLIGHTMVRPARFGSVMTASSGTIIHSPSRRTR